MSKRHQASRRKTYGRRQHEVRERHDRGQHAEGFEFELGETPAVGDQGLAPRLDVPLEIAILLLKVLRLQEQPLGPDDPVIRRHRYPKTKAWLWEQLGFGWHRERPPAPDGPACRSMYNELCEFLERINEASARRRGRDCVPLPYFESFPPPFSVFSRMNCCS